MSHRTLSAAAVVLLASAPLLAAAPANAAPQQDFPCAVGIQKVDGPLVSTVSLSIRCAETQTVGVRITAGGVERVSLKETVQADVQQSVTVTVPRVPQACATLQADGVSSTICTP